MVLDYEFDKRLKEILIRLVEKEKISKKDSETVEEFAERMLHPLRIYLRNKKGYDRNGTGCWMIKSPNSIDPDDVEDYF